MEPVLAALHERTVALAYEYPLDAETLVGCTLQAWNSLPESRIGRARIGVDLFPVPQIIGTFLHELIPLEVQSTAGPDWQGDYIAAEKDLVYIPNARFSTEIKTSSSERQVFGNRSFGQPETVVGGKKEKGGYYLAINFTGWSRSGLIVSRPRIRLIRFGWLDHTDWLAQGAASGQNSTLAPLTENSQMLTLFDDRQ